GRRGAARRGPRARPGPGRRDPDRPRGDARGPRGGHAGLGRAGVTEVRIVDVTDEPTFRSIPPCADPGFDHRTCDYWEDADRGSKAARLSWLPGAAAPPPAPAASRPRNPFGDDADDEPLVNPFAPVRKA